MPASDLLKVQLCTDVRSIYLDEGASPAASALSTPLLLWAHPLRPLSACLRCSTSRVAALSVAALAREPRWGGQKRHDEPTRPIRSSVNLVLDLLLVALSVVIVKSASVCQTTSFCAPSATQPLLPVPPPFPPAPFFARPPPFPFNPTPRILHPCPPQSLVRPPSPPLCCS